MSEPTTRWGALPGWALDKVLVRASYAALPDVVDAGPGEYCAQRRARAGWRDPWRVAEHDWDGTPDGDLSLSTVFLGYDAAFGRGTPLYFETLVLGGAGAGDRLHTRRYAGALAIHEALALALAARYGPPDRWLVNDGREARLLPARCAREGESAWQ